MPLLPLLFYRNKKWSAHSASGCHQKTAPNHISASASRPLLAASPAGTPGGVSWRNIWRRTGSKAIHQVRDTKKRYKNHWLLKGDLNMLREWFTIGLFANHFLSWTHLGAHFTLSLPFCILTSVSPALHMHWWCLGPRYWTQGSCWCGHKTMCFTASLHESNRCFVYTNTPTFNCSAVLLLSGLANLSI